LAGGVCAAGALWFVYASRAPEGKAIAAAPAVSTTAVIVAAQDIPFGEPLLPEMLAQIEWPTRGLPKDIVLDKDELLKGPDGARIALRAFVAGEPFLKAKISGYGERPILSRKVAEGMRAFTIRINDVSGVAGFMLPGDRVDVMLTREIDNKPDNLLTDTLLQNVSVLGVGQLSSDEEDEPTVAKSATLEVTPEQAQKLALASELGTLSLSLRNHKNLDEAQLKPLGVNDLEGPKKTVPKSAAPKAENGIYVRVRRGEESSNERVPQ
jgi:pilus assembly protein CpaB